MIIKYLKYYSRNVKKIQFKNINYDNDIYFSKEKFFPEHLQKEKDINLIEKFYLDNKNDLEISSIHQFLIKFIKNKNNIKYENYIKDLEDNFFKNFDSYELEDHIYLIQILNYKKIYKPIYLDKYIEFFKNKDIKSEEVYFYLINTMYEIDKIKYKEEILNLNKIFFIKELEISIIKNIKLFEINLNLVNKLDYIYKIETKLKNNWKKLDLENIFRIINLYYNSNYIHLDLNFIEDLSLYFWKKVNILDINKWYTIIKFYGKYENKNLNIKSFLDKSVKKIINNINDLEINKINDILFILTKLEYYEENNIDYIYNHVSKKLELLNENELLNFNLSHNNILFNKINFYEKNKHLFYKRSLKNISKYNQIFYQFIIPILEPKIKDLSIEYKWKFIILFNEIKTKQRELKRFYYNLGINEFKKILEEDWSSYDHNKFKIIKELTVNLEKLSYNKKLLKEFSELKSKMKLNINDINLITGIKKLNN